MAQVFWRVKGFFYQLGDMALSSSSVRPSFVKRSMIRVMVLLPIPYRFWVVLYPMPPWRNSITPMIVE